MGPDTSERAAAVAALLRDYDRLLLAADHAPAAMWVRARPRRPNVRWDPWRLPRPALLLRFFVRAHVRRAVDALRRRLSAERALEGPTSALEEEREAVVRYQDAIPPTHGRAIALVLAAAALIVGRLAVQYAGQVLSSVPALTHVQRGDLRGGSSAERSIAFSDKTAALMRGLGESLTEGVPSPSKVVNVVLSARLGDIAVVLASASFALYVALRPCVPGFRLKRMLFNVAADTGALAASTARWHVARRIGVYAAEQRVFEQLGTRPPREVPFDLLVSALLCAVPLGLGTYLLTRTRWEVIWLGWTVFDLTLVIGLLLLALAGLRIGWLLRTARRRNRGDDRLRAPYDVRLPDGRHAVVRDPLGVALVVYFVPHVFVLWLAGIAREIRGVAIRPALRMPPPTRLLRWLGALALAAVAGWLLLQVPVAPLTFLIPARALQSWPPGTWWPWWLAWAFLALTAPPVAALGQVTVNRLWRRLGTPVPEGPTKATVATEHSTGEYHGEVSAS